MEIRELSIKGVLEIKPRLFHDERGFFFESYHEKSYSAIGLPQFVQDNQSFSVKGVIRGLHLQKSPYAQGKLVRVIKGKILDVVVDLRKNSPTFGKHESLVLDDVTNNMIYVPEGFAHGFAALENSIVLYKCTNFYHKESETGIKWDDATLGIDWGVQNPIVSDKDQQLLFFEELVELAEKEAYI